MGIRGQTLNANNRSVRKIEFSISRSRIMGTNIGSFYLMVWQAGPMSPVDANEVEKGWDEKVDNNW